MEATLPNIVYRSESAPGFLMRDALLTDDEQLTALIAEAMPSNGMILSFDRAPSYFQATRTLYTQPEIKVLVMDDQPDRIIGMVNFGWKDCYINGQHSTIRYVADLRLRSKARGQNTLDIIVEYLYQNVPRESFYESVVLNDNLMARHVLHRPREKFPVPFMYDDITTYTISKVKPPASNLNLRIQTMDETWIERVNQFVDALKDDFNFLPTYDFNQLKEGNHHYWKGMQLSDFSVVLNPENEIVGLFGLWNQKSFKQTRVKKYSLSLKLLRPFYNAWAKQTGQLLLPKEQDSFDYLMLHSALCKPSNVEVYQYILYQAYIQMKQRNKNAFCTTLAHKDPRITAMKDVKAHVMHATHGLHSYETDAYQYFDQDKISYFEVGRI
ncbi:GNAT family N-acetyltransferase [Acinetobacter shaoyimingii]|uniref:GNAT family N-acetyltransferase n=1 Tax=Acinetobacter shaoyimingii TaxID=2715164 RepID=A0A6G8RWM5_9GAMM|nr:GNAT family N-acetyltransferase [Acinetobacter shaoyimingii]NHB57063.1 GNAT family N-acetyltransferase [Acinetobacter shaoyimingii]QIO06314.1 GNAT family N-acetyltransferase [Acinetobacter shaoyimingii]